MNEKANLIIVWILQRLGEQSTWKGIFGLLTTFGVFLKPDQAAQIMATGIGLIALINCFRNEGKAAEKAVAQSDKVREIVAQVNSNTASVNAINQSAH